MTPKEEQRFWSRIRKTEEHWYWEGGKYHNGFGYLNVGGNTKAVRRISYEMHQGDLPPGKRVQVLCGETTCVNPDHLGLSWRVAKRRAAHPRHGVCWHPGGAWVAHVGAEYVGYFKNELDAYRCVIAHRQVRGELTDKYRALADKVGVDLNIPAECVLAEFEASRPRAARAPTHPGLGVTWCGQTVTWQVKVMYQGKTCHSRGFGSELEAYRAALQMLVEMGAPDKRTEPFLEAIAHHEPQMVRAS